jgi:hypothetical protein
LSGFFLLLSLCYLSLSSPLLTQAHAHVTVAVSCYHSGERVRDAMISKPPLMLDAGGEEAKNQAKREEERGERRGGSQTGAGRQTSSSSENQASCCCLFW